MKYGFFLLLIFLHSFVGAQKTSSVSRGSAGGNANDTTVVREKKGKPIQIGLGMQAINYVGDFTDQKFDRFRAYPGANISVQTVSNKRLHLQFNVGAGSFADQIDKETTLLQPSSADVAPNAFVYTNIIYGDVRFKYLIFPTSRIKPFVSVGAGGLFFSPQDAKSRNLSEPENGTRPEGEEYSIFTFQMPASAGVEIKATPGLSFGLAYNYHFAASDYLDNISSLGKRKGGDHFQTVLFSICITPNPIKESTEIPIYKPKKPVKSDTLISLKEKKKPKEEVVPEKVVPKEPEIAFEEETEKQDSLSNADMQDLSEMLKGASEWVSQISKGAAEAEAEEKREAERELELKMTDEEREERAIQNQSFVYYKIKAGDSVEKIAQRFKVKKATILSLNNLSPTKPLPAGMTIKLPDVGVEPK